MNLDKMMSILDSNVRRFAGITELPYSFFNGERISGGLSDAGVKIDYMMIEDKKNEVFNKMKPFMLEIMQVQYNMGVTDITLHVEETLEVDDKDDTIKEIQGTIDEV